ncbi:hypothetical protein L3X38_015267 [Prunus dulcis]|uniref:Uncharacterized protein n=1 Tax=Prunus dulcis TaxID=3755 RepID=A0AAD4WPS5_PRUDU|nr:hypothetical protein L3X38_015267 [Prunus dulcis]
MIVPSKTVVEEVDNFNTQLQNDRVTFFSANSKSKIPSALVNSKVPRHIPLLLGRLFLTTAGTLQDVQQGTLTLRVQGESTEFKVFEAVIKLGDLEDCDCIYLLDPIVHVNYLENTSTDVLKAKSPPPLVVKRMRTSLGLAGIYQCFIKSFSKMSRLLWHLLAKNHTNTLLDKAIVRKEFRQQPKQLLLPHHQRHSKSLAHDYKEKLLGKHYQLLFSLMFLVYV